MPTNQSLQLSDIPSLDPSDVVTYKASKTCRAFHNSDAFVRLLIGPIGSGKSVACCLELFRIANLQAPDKKGIRKTKWAVIRNTYRELVDTTCKTWLDWFPKELGLWSQMNMSHRIITKNPDGTTTDMEVLFRALDKPADIKKLLSLELTGGWINEAREIPKAILDALIGRVGRYPPVKDGVPATWDGVIMDTNPPDSDHYIYNIFEEDGAKISAEVLEDLSEEVKENVLAAKWEKFHQPSGLSNEAENKHNLPVGYYERMMPGKDQEWIKVYVHGEYGFVTDGMPVIPEFHDNVHVLQREYHYNSDLPLLVGVDFGRTPAATFGQEQADGQIIIFDELVTFGTSATNFAKLLASRIKGHYPNSELIATGDPAGENPGEQIDDTCIDILNNSGIPIDGAYTNNFTIRREAVSIPLTQLTVTGKPQLVITPQCIVLRKAMNGGYRYKRMQVSGEHFQNKPDKGKYSHVAESLQYLLLGIGKGYDVIASNYDTTKFKVIGALK